MPIVQFWDNAPSHVTTIHVLVHLRFGLFRPSPRYRASKKEARNNYINIFVWLGPILLTVLVVLKTLRSAPTVSVHEEAGRTPSHKGPPLAGLIPEVALCKETGSLLFPSDSYRDAVCCCK